MKDLTGEKYGSLTVIKRVDDHIYNNGRKDIVYECICDCGNKKDVLAAHLRSGHTQSCGCKRAEMFQKCDLSMAVEIQDCIQYGRT